MQRTLAVRRNREPVSGMAWCILVFAALLGCSCYGWALHTKEVTTALVDFSNHRLTRLDGHDLPRNSTDVNMWPGVIRICSTQPPATCSQTIFSFLNKVLEIDSLNLTDEFSLAHEDIAFAYGNEAAHQRHANASGDSKADGSGAVAALKNKVLTPISKELLNFIMSYNMQFRLLAIYLAKATKRISPTSLEDDAIKKTVELIPTQGAVKRETSRIFKKKIHKFFRNKLILSFLAIILIIKLIKIKLFWLLPLIIGVGAAKKLLLKLLLFLFPALSHLFKLCPYYPEYHETKFHHHQHQINHHHTVHPPWHKQHHQQNPSSVFLPNGPELIFTDPPKYPPSEYYHRFHRKNYVSSTVNGKIPTGSSQVHHSVGVWNEVRPNTKTKFVTDKNENYLFDPKNKIILNPSYSIEAPLNPHQNIDIADHIGSHKYDPVTYPYQSFNVSSIYWKAQEPTVDHHKQKTNILEAQAIMKENIRIRAEQMLIANQQKILDSQPFDQSTEFLPVTSDGFYGPIIENIDNILSYFGPINNHCKELLVCEMYKTPSKFTPLSNFLSAELSRESDDLQKPAARNAAGFRFFRFVQAARDGQAQEDCPRMYSQCSNKS